MFFFVNYLKTGKYLNMEQRTKWITKIIFIAVLVDLGKLRLAFFCNLKSILIINQFKKCSCKLNATEISVFGRYFRFLKEIKMSINKQ